MSHIDDPCDSNDVWLRRARYAMGWDWLVKALPDMMMQPYQRDFMDALLRSSISNERIVIEPKRPGGNSYVEKGDMAIYLFATGGKDVIPLDDPVRRFMVIGVDHADGPDELVKLTKPELKAIKERYDRQQPPHWKGKRPR